MRARIGYLQLDFMQFTLLKIHTLDYLRAKLITKCLQDPEPIYRVPVHDLAALIRHIKMQTKGSSIINALYKQERPDDALVPFQTVDGTRLLPAIAPVFYEDINKVSLPAAMVAWLTPTDSTWTWTDHYPEAAERLKYLHYGWAYECPVIKPFLCLATWLIDELDDQSQPLFHANFADIDAKSLEAIVRYYRPDITPQQIQRISRTIRV